jgi:hypothetical protein
MAGITDINLAFMLVSFIIGMVLALISIISGNYVIKIAIFLMGFLPILAVLLGAIPIGEPMLNATIQQNTDRVTNLIMVFVNFVLPYLIGVAFSNAGGQFVNNLHNQIGER